MFDFLKKQITAFINEGQLADYFGPGHHKLDTANLPLLPAWRSGAHVMM